MVQKAWHGAVAITRSRKLGASASSGARGGSGVSSRCMGSSVVSGAGTLRRRWMGVGGHGGGEGVEGGLGATRELGVGLVLCSWGDELGEGLG